MVAPRYGARNYTPKAMSPGETSAIPYLLNKLDGVGPVDNRPSND